MEKKSFLAQFLEDRTEERRAELSQAPIEDILKESMEEIGLYVFECYVDYVGPTGFCGTATVATDGMPERAREAVEEVFRSQGIEEFEWRNYPVPGQISAIWEVVHQDEETD